MLKLFSFIQHKKQTEKHERACNDHDYCHVEMSSEDNKILTDNQGEKSLKVPAYYLCWFRVSAHKNAFMSK